MVRLEEYKQQTKNNTTEKLPLPSCVWIPLSQHVGKICQPQVKIGDTVLTGQRIAGVDAHIYAPIHASISGKVVAIQDWPHPVLGRCKAVVIESDGEDAKTENRKPKTEEIDKLTPDEIRKIVLESGITGMGGAGFPTHIKLSPPKPVDTLIINGAECEPYLTGDYRLMLEKTEEILLGVELVARCLGVSKVYIAIEDNKPHAIEKFNPALYQKCGTKFKIKVLKTQYPAGGEKQLIKNILNKEVPSGKLPFDIGVVVQSVATVFAVYEAVYLHKPLYERVVTVTGSCLTNPKNLWVRIGTPLKDLLNFCGPLKEEPAKIVIGGPMMGIAQYSLDVPVTKTTTAIILMNKKEARMQEEEFCIRCGACIRECPVGLEPCLISLASQSNNWKLAEDYNVLDCIECGLCSFVCPAKRNMVQYMKYAKFMLAK